MDKKGVEMTMSTIVVIALVLIVLLVLLFILLKSSQGFNLGVTSCEDRGGRCDSDAQSCTSSGGQVYRLGSCKDGVCCLPQEVTGGEDER